MAGGGCRSAQVDLRGQPAGFSLNLPPGGVQGSNSNCRAWQQQAKSQLASPKNVFSKGKSVSVSVCITRRSTKVPAIQRDMKASSTCMRLPQTNRKVHSSAVFRISTVCAAVTTASSLQTKIPVSGHPLATLLQCAWPQVSHNPPRWTPSVHPHSRSQPVVILCLACPSPWHTLATHALY